VEAQPKFSESLERSRDSSTSSASESEATSERSSNDRLLRDSLVRSPQGRTRTLINNIKMDRYNKKNASFKKLFQIPPEENLNYDVSAALLRHMLHHGRLYMCENFVCFYSKVFGIRIVEKISRHELISIEKESTNLVNPGITIKNKEGTEYHFASMLSREKTYQRLLNWWKEIQGSGSPVEENTVEELIIENSTREQPDVLDQESNKELDDELTIELSSHDSKHLIENDALEVILSADLNTSPLKFFKWFYSDQSELLTSYHISRGDKDLTMENWTEHPEYGKFRTINYIAPVKAAIGPSQTRLEETQRAYVSKERVTIETVSRMHDIPYGDYFRVESRHEVLATGDNKCKLTMSCQVNFLKRTFFEGKIKTGTMTEMKSSCSMWQQIVQQEIAKRSKGEIRVVSSGPAATATVAAVVTPSNDIVLTPAPPPVVVVNTPNPTLLSVGMSTIQSTLKEEIRTQLLFFVILVLLLLILVIQISSLNGRMSSLEEKIEFLNRALLMAHMQNKQ